MAPEWHLGLWPLRRLYTVMLPGYVSVTVSICQHGLEIGLHLCQEAVGGQAVLHVLKVGFLRQSANGGWKTTMGKPVRQHGEILICWNHCWNIVELTISGAGQNAWPDYAECLGQLIFPILLSYYFTDDTLIVAQGSAAMWRAWTESTSAVSASTCLLPEFLGSSARCCKMLQDAAKGGGRPTILPSALKKSIWVLALKNKTKVVHAAVKTRGTTRERKSLECQQDGPAGLSLTPVASASSSDVWDCLGLQTLRLLVTFPSLWTLTWRGLWYLVMDLHWAFNGFYIHLSRSHGPTW